MAGQGRPRTAVGTWGTIKTARLANKRWVAKGRVRDSHGVLRLVSRTADTKQGALNAVQEGMRERAAEVTTGGDLTKDTEFRILAERYLSIVKSTQAPSTYDRYYHNVHSILIPEIGALPLRSLTTSRLQALFGKFQEAGRKPGGQRNILSSLSGALQLAVEDNVLDFNPARNVKINRRESSYATEALDEEQIAQLLEAAAKCTVIGEGELHDVLALLLGTGARISEILGLRWCDIRFGYDTRANVIEIRKNAVYVRGQGVILREGKTKASKRDIVMTPMVRDVMRRRSQMLGVEPSQPVFPVGAQLRHRYPSGVRKHLTDSVYATLPFMQGVKQPTHIFRRTAALMMYEQGMTPLEIANQLGHSSVKMTMDVYLKRTGGSERAAEALDFTSRRRKQLKAQGETLQIESHRAD